MSYEGDSGLFSSRCMGATGHMSISKLCHPHLSPPSLLYKIQISKPSTHKKIIKQKTEKKKGEKARSALPNSNSRVSAPAIPSRRGRRRRSNFNQSPIKLRTKKKQQWRSTRSSRRSAKARTGRCTRPRTNPPANWSL